MADELRKLRRSRSDRVIAGVLGGLGRRLGIDPIILRVATAVLVVFGGVGVLLYALAWLLIPADDDPASVLDQAMGNRDVRDPSAIPLALGLGSVIVISSGIAIGTSWNGRILLILAAVGLFVLLKRRSYEPETRSYAPSYPDEPQYVYDVAAGAWIRQGAAATPATSGYGDAGAAGGGGTAAATDAGAADVGPASSAAVDADADADLGEAGSAAATTTPAAGTTGPGFGTTGPGTGAARPPQSAGGWPEPDWGVRSPYDGLYLQRDRQPEPERPEPEKPVAKKRPRSVLGLLTFCTALLAVGVLAVSDALWDTSPDVLYIAVPLLIVALGLIVGAWYGRSRGLIFLGIPLALAMVPAVLIDGWDTSTGEVNLTAPPELENLPSTAVTHGLGPVTYDLSALEMTDHDDVNITMDLGAGDMHVVLPPNADVVVVTSVGAGSVDFLGDESDDGLGRESTFTDEGPDGVGGGQINLTLEVGLGSIDINRAAPEVSR